ncbi:leucyl/phenylalanyl-tRNA--protein transferase [Micrococcales bacterium 31B]|nr:leucyl/phenylalanyl-tRNA--protein transferase [Micrococcales bacterium 31B]
MTQDGDLVAVGGDLAPETLLGAYSRGLFPMPFDGVAHRDPGEVGEPRPGPGAAGSGRSDSTLAWFRPQERGVLLPGRYRLTTSLRRQLKHFSFTLDAEFAEVTTRCGDPRRDHGWINAEFIAAYMLLHEQGFAHSIETWRDGELVGGLYGVSVGGLFAGESMFHAPTPAGRDASKAALIALCALLEGAPEPALQLIDTQWVTPHLESLGVMGVSAADYDVLRGRALTAVSGLATNPGRFRLDARALA